VDAPQDHRHSTARPVAVVTGGMGGLGEAICRRLADDDFTVVALHSPANTQALSWLVAQEARGYHFGTVEADVRQFGSCAAAAESVRQRYGRISVLVNNAGIARDASFRRMAPEDWDEVLRTNLDSVFNMTRQVIDDMLLLGWGRIVNIGSLNAQRGAVGQANYAASKAGIHGFTKCLALESASKNITVNTVSPGYLRTPATDRMPPQDLHDRVLPAIPVGRLGDPQEVAELVAYLVSDRAAFVTGADLPINGGQYME
jgi:acetoacetyl-CoA reductase